MDSLTQLQEWLGSTAERFYTALGILQRDAVPLSKTTGQLPPHVEQQIRGFARDILYAKNVLEAVIAQLPRRKRDEKEEAELFVRLQQENRQSGEKLEDALRRTEALLASVRNAIQEIAQDRLSDLHDPPPYRL